MAKPEKERPLIHFGSPPGARFEEPEEPAAEADPAPVPQPSPMPVDKKHAEDE